MAVENSSGVNYARDPHQSEWDPDWVPFSDATIQMIRTYQGHGFLPSHDPRLSRPTAEIAGVGSFVIDDKLKRVGRHMLKLAEKLQLPEASGMTANQLELSHIIGSEEEVPSMSLVWLAGKHRLILNPRMEYETEDPTYTETDVWSQGCLNNLGLAAIIGTRTDGILRGHELVISGNATAVTLGWAGGVQPETILEQRNAQHECDHARTKKHPGPRLCFDRLRAAGGSLLRLNMEEFGVYGKWLRGKVDPAEFTPATVPWSQYDATINPNDPRMKTESFKLSTEAA